MRLIFTIIFAAMFAAILVAGVMLDPVQSAPLSAVAAATTEPYSAEQKLDDSWWASRAGGPQPVQPAILKFS